MSLAHTDFFHLVISVSEYSLSYWIETTCELLQLTLIPLQKWESEPWKNFIFSTYYHITKNLSIKNIKSLVLRTYGKTVYKRKILLIVNYFKVEVNLSSEMFTITWL